MQSKKLHHAIRSALLGIPVIALSLPAVAQDEPTLEEIIVTARKAEESILDVPLSISAFTAAEIEAAGLEDINDLAQLTPGFSFRSGFGRTGDRPVIRGMSNIQGQPNASFFIDGVFVSGSISGYPLDNLERVEVIRGPQSALFGRRTFSGAINYITRPPSDEFDANIKLTGAEDNEWEASAYASGPLGSSSARFEVNVGAYEFGGQYTNQLSDEVDIGGETSQWIGGALYFSPTDSLDIKLRANYLENDDDHPVIGRIGSDLLNCFLPVDGGSRLFGPPGNNFAPVVFDTRTRGYFCGEPEIPEFSINTSQFSASGFPAGLRRDALRTSATAELAISPTLDLTAQLAFNNTETISAIDQDYSAIRGFGGAFETVDESETEDMAFDLRLQSAQDAAWRWLAGVYYYNEEFKDGRTGSLAGFFPGGFNGPAISLDPVDSDSEVESIALYGLVEFTLADRWTATIEARAAEDDILSAGTSTFTARDGTVFMRDFSNTDTFSNVTPRFTLSYDANDDVLVYGQIAQGTKPGGFNDAVESARISESGRAELNALGFLTFDEEEVWSYELGTKASFPSNGSVLSAALFFLDWDQQQLTESVTVEDVTGALFATSYTANLGESEVTGLELDYSYPINEAFDIRATYAWMDSEITDFVNQDQADLFNSNGQAAGNELPRVPKHQATITGNFNYDMSNGWGYFLRVDASYESSRFAQIHNLIETGDSTIVNLRTGFSGDNWTATLFVRNLTDEDAPDDILRYIDPDEFIFFPQLPERGGGVTGNFLRDFAVSAPRQQQAGITLTYRF